MDPGTKQIGTLVSGLFVVIIICACCIYFVIQVKDNMGASPAPGRAPGPGPAPATGSGPLCTSVNVSKYPSPSPPPSLTITAPTGTTISSVDYASLGNPTGVCGAFTDGSCAIYPDSAIKNLFSTACVGKNTCSVNIDPTTFGTLSEMTDAVCQNNIKMQVQYTTTNPSPAPSPAH